MLDQKEAVKHSQDFVEDRAQQLEQHRIGDALNCAPDFDLQTNVEFLFGSKRRHIGSSLLQEIKDLEIVKRDSEVCRHSKRGKRLLNPGHSVLRLIKRSEKVLSEDLPKELSKRTGKRGECSGLEDSRMWRPRPC